MEKTGRNVRYRSNETSFRFFSNVNFKDAREDYAVFVGKAIRKARKGLTTIAAYFDDEEDEYEVSIVHFDGSHDKRKVYSWDELSTIVHDYI